MKTNQCCSLTKRGKRCNNKKMNYSISGFCTYHETRNGVHYNTEMECSICIQPMKNPLKLRSCTHTFCTHCVSKWLYHHDSCPYCRTKVDDFHITRAVLFGVVNEEIIYLYRYTYSSSNLTEDEIDSLPVVFNKEYSFEEWELLTKDHKGLITKMRFTFDNIITDYTEEYSQNNLLMRII